MIHIWRVSSMLVFLILSFSCVAQDVTYSQYDKFDYRSDAYTVVGKTGGRVYTYIRNDDGARLDAFNDSMGKVATVLLDFFPSRIYQVRFVAYPNKIMVLYQALESNKVVQYAALLDEEGLLKGKPIVIGSVKTGIFGATKNYFSSCFSDDKKHILVYSTTEKNNEIVFEGTWVNDSGVVVKRGKASFKTENTPEHGEVSIANDGTVYIPAYTPVGSQNYADQIWILSLPIGGTKFEAKELELGEKFATSGYIKVDKSNNSVYFGGFYSDTKNGNFDGIIYAAYNISTGIFASKRFIPFDAELMKAAGPSRKGHTFDNYVVRQLIVKNDGGFVLISEINFITVRSSFAPGFGYYSSFYSPYMNSNIREYHYNDIMALAYNKDGVREWDAFIPKQQYSQEDEGVFSSYALLNTGGTIVLLYNDFDPNHSHIQFATLSPEGKTEVHGLPSQIIDYPDWLPRFAKQVAGRRLIVPCFRKKQICFASVVF